jgi:hypothetical protein
MANERMKCVDGAAAIQKSSGQIHGSALVGPEVKRKMCSMTGGAVSASQTPSRRWSRWSEDSDRRRFYPGIPVNIGATTCMQRVLNFPRSEASLIASLPEPCGEEQAGVALGWTVFVCGICLAEVEWPKNECKCIKGRGSKRAQSRSPSPISSTGCPPAAGVGSSPLKSCH